MEITYENICNKLGFTLENYKPDISDYEDDSKISPFFKTYKRRIGFFA